MRQDESVDNGRKGLDRLKDGTEAARDAAALPRSTVVVQLSREHYDRVCVSDGADTLEILALIVGQYALEILDGVFQALSRAGGPPG